MRVLGVDPGLQITGYGVISFRENIASDKALDLIEAGVVRTGSGDGISERLRKVHEALSDVIEELRPDFLAIEKLYTHTRHPATAILMGHVRGVVCLLSALHGIPLVNIASTHVKKSLTGNGHADKNQIQRMVQHILNLKKAPEPPDVADAIAIGISCAYSLRGKIKQGTKLRKAAR